MPEVSASHQAERLNHALYGLIIITATLVAEQIHVTEAGEALAILLSAALVLVLAHTYTAYMAERAVEGQPLGANARRLVLADNFPVLSAVVIPGILFIGAALGWIQLSVAFNASIAYAIATLFALGLYEAFAAGIRGVRLILGGFGAAAIGLMVVAIEVFFE